MTRPGPKVGMASMTKKPHPDFPFRFSNVYFRTQEERDKYAWQDRVRKAAKRAGWPHKTINELKAFEEHRNKYYESVKIQREKDLAVKEERRKLKEELGVHPKSNMAKYALSPQAPALNLIQKQAQARLNDTEKLVLIKQMIEERTPIQDFMIRTSQLVGAKL